MKPEEPEQSVLLIEDNPGDARLIREMLAEDPASPFHITVADRLARGLEVLAQKDFYRITTSPKERGLQIHLGFVKFEQISKSEFCASCHQVAVQPHEGIFARIIEEDHIFDRPGIIALPHEPILGRVCRRDVNLAVVQAPQQVPHRQTDQCSCPSRPL